MPPVEKIRDLGTSQKISKPGHNAKAQLLTTTWAFAVLYP